MYQKAKVLKYAQVNQDMNIFLVWSKKIRTYFKELIFKLKTKFAEREKKMNSVVNKLQ